MEKYEKMINNRKEYSSLKVEKVAKKIDELIEKGDDISFYSISKKAKCSRSFLYNHECLRKRIEDYNHNKLEKSNSFSQKTLVESLKMEITRLKKELNSNKSSKLISDVERLNRELTEEKMRYENLKKEYDKLLDKYLLKYDRY